MNVGETYQASQNHVKFKLEEEEFKSHHEHLEIHQMAEDVYNVNLGYLKMNHNYKFSFELEGVLGDFVYLKEESSPHVTFKEIKTGSNGHRSFLCIFHAYKEKSEIENVIFEVKNNDKPYRLTICFEAKVLGTHQGTPSLRNGITLLHHGHDHPHHNHLIDSKQHFSIV